jgi:DNA-binding transcriptional MerR regulator/methylmalonyl-CoA mutase cobalamin-binding subunit
MGAFRPSESQMNDNKTLNSQSLSIGSAERETGLSKDTLRMWERRYGFPQPIRDTSGERVYPMEQVEKLRLLKQLLDRGHRPGKIIARNADELRALSIPNAGAPGAQENPHEQRADLQHYIALCKAYRFDEFRRALSQELLRIGLFRLVVEVIAPLNTMVGARWADGTFAIFEEHLYTESVQVVMRNAISAIPSPAHMVQPRPRILLTTFPQEPHSLGLLMAEAIFSLEGARCISLGVQTPITDIARAAETQQADIVALSFSASMNGAQALEGLKDLHARLAPATDIWVGGACAILRRRPPADVQVLDLPHIGTALGEWRARHQT